MSDVSQPNLIETIEKALNNISAIIPANQYRQWLRALLEENKLAEQTLAVKDDTIAHLDSQLQQTREENERLKSFVEYTAKGLPGIVRKARETLSIYPPRREEDEA